MHHSGNKITVKYIIRYYVLRIYVEGNIKAKVYLFQESLKMKEY